MPVTTIQTAQIRDTSVTEAKLSLSDVTTGDVTTSRHGFVPKAPNDSNQFLNGLGQWSTTSAGALNPSPGNNQFSGPSATFTAATALAQWDVCYITSASKMAKASAVTISTAYPMAICTNAIAQDSSTTFALCGAFVQNNAWTWTPGGVLYLSASTAGAMTQVAPSSSGQCVVIVGIALNATTIMFEPQLVIVELV